jgi:hypothetical protein
MNISNMIEVNRFDYQRIAPTKIKIVLSGHYL